MKKFTTITLTLLLCLALASCGDSKSGDPESDNSTTTSIETTSTSSTAQPNTSAKVDEILSQARNDINTFSDGEVSKTWDDAFQYLKAHADNFYEDNETMEHSMYYGAFLYLYVEANTPAKNISELEDSTRAAYDAGYNAVKAIKYVYRGVETQEDDDTKNALAKAQEALSKFE